MTFQYKRKKPTDIELWSGILYLGSSRSIKLCVVCFFSPSFKVPAELVKLEEWIYPQTYQKSKRRHVKKRHSVSEAESAAVCGIKQRTTSEFWHNFEWLMLTLPLFYSLLWIMHNLLVLFWVHLHFLLCFLLKATLIRPRQNLLCISW